MADQLIELQLESRTLMSEFWSNLLRISRCSQIIPKFDILWKSIQKIKTGFVVKWSMHNSGLNID